MISSSKGRIIYIAKILENHTDEEHFLTTTQIINLLESEYGIPAYRTTVQEDIDLLIEAGMDIEIVKSSQNKYHLCSREFDVAELKMLIDAVESCKFITKDKSRRLAKKLGNLAGPYIAEELVRNIAVEKRVKTENKQVYYIVDKINSAINSKNKIKFQYFKYNTKKERELKNNGDFYYFSPYKLVWNGEYYYVVGYSDKHEKIVNFRIDRFAKSPVVLEERAVPIPKGFNMDMHLNSMIRMYDSNREKIMLICDNSVVDGIIDYFGEDIEIKEIDEHSFKVVVDCAVSHVFLSWIFGFKGLVKIASPDDVVEKYRDMVIKALNSVENN